MASTISAGTTSGTAIAIAGDTSGALALLTNNGTTAVTIDTSQNVGIGTSSPTGFPGYKTVQTDATSGGLFEIKVNGTRTFNFQSDASTALIETKTAIPITFGTTATERMRISSGGGVLIGTSTGSGTGRLQVFSTTQALYANCTNNVSGDIGTVLGLGANCNNTSSYHLICSTGGPDKMYILGNGNLQNVNNSYGTLSDVKLKENIVDATPKLDKLMQLQVRNFTLKADETKLKQIGFVAQEIEQIFPSIIEEISDLDEERNLTGTTTKGVKTSVLIPILVKAIQELTAKVDAQALEIQALKGVA
jgi:hypothetical protein